MTKNRNWNDENWLLLMQLYLKKPVGLKPLYSKAMVNLSLELHIAPEILYEQMFRLRSLDTPKMERLWATYAHNPNKLRRGVKLLRMKNKSWENDGFFEGVAMNESFEKDFKPIAANEKFTPVMLIMILDLYFRLTPATMVVETPEVIELSQKLKLKPADVVDVMDVFRFCDPYLNRDDIMIHPLLPACQEVWDRFDYNHPEKIAALAAQLEDYFA